MKILLIDSESENTRSLVKNWQMPNTELTHSMGGKEAINYISQGGLGVVFISTKSLLIENLDTLTLVKEKNSGVDVYILTEKEDTTLAGSAVQKGAHSFLVNPLELPMMEAMVRKSMIRALTRKNHRILEEHLMMDLLGSAPSMEKILQTMAKVAPTNSSIMVEGETGTGKEFLANLIHRMSSRAEGPFIAVNCAAIPESLIESELFGAKKGAYTGATNDRKGLFEEADTGTLFLDEIGDLPQNIQVKLLRFLQEKEIRKLGQNESKIVDVRIIAATNVNLKEAVKNGSFREDLFYRLNVFHLLVPPLRQRRGNVPHMIRYFVKKYSKENNTYIKGIAKDAEQLLLNYEFPGNIRELENLIEHAVVLCDGDYILVTHLPDAFTAKAINSEALALPNSQNVSSNPQNIKSLSELERDHIINSLQILNNNQTEVARVLGVSRSTLWRKIKDLNINI